MKQISLFIALLVSFFPLAQAQDIQWPGKAAVAVSLSYDDTLPSQLDNAIPTLDQYGIKGSFYLSLSTPVLTERLADWRAAAASGHELGNHSIFHACSKSQQGTDWVLDYKNLDTRVIAQMREELEVANGFLHSIDGKSQRTYTPPCLHTQVKDGNYIEAVRDLFVGIKGQENNVKATLIMPNGQSGEELIALLQEAASQYELVNVLFHGIGAEHLAVSVEAHEQFLQYLDANRDTYWADTYGNIMSHVNAQKN